MALSTELRVVFASMNNTACYAAIAVIISTCLFQAGASADSPIPASVGSKFTLVYSVSESDLRNQKSVSDGEEIQRRQYAIAVQRGQMKQEQADQALSLYHHLSQPHPPVLSVITISSDGTKLLYSRTTQNSNQTTIYDGKQSFILEGNGSTKPSYDLEIRSGLEPVTLTQCPLPGNGLPFLPLYDPSQPLYFSSTSDACSGKIITMDVKGAAGAAYLPGTIKYQKANVLPRITSVTIAQTPTSILEKWSYSKQVLINGRWIPSLITWQQYGFDGSVPFTTPQTFRRYTLVKAISDSLPSDKLNALNYLTRASVVYSGVGKDQVAFTYNPNSGDLDQQRERQRRLNQQLATFARQGHIPSQNHAAAFVILGLFFLAGGYGIRRIVSQKQRKS